MRIILISFSDQMEQENPFHCFRFHGKFVAFNIQVNLHIMLNFSSDKIFFFQVNNILEGKPPPKDQEYFDMECGVVSHCVSKNYGVIDFMQECEGYMFCNSIFRIGDPLQPGLSMCHYVTILWSSIDSSDSCFKMRYSNILFWWAGHLFSTNCFLIPY